MTVSLAVYFGEKIPARLQKKFAPIARTILKANYELDVGFVSPRRIQEVNKQYRDKDKPTNILSFPLSDTSGQIIICPVVTKKEASSLYITADEYIQFLFIHGLLHLIGFDHGATMEHKEQEYCAQFKLKLGNLWHEQSQPA